MTFRVWLWGTTLIPLAGLLVGGCGARTDFAPFEERDVPEAGARPEAGRDAGECTPTCGPLPRSPVQFAEFDGVPAHFRVDDDCVRTSFDGNLPPAVIRSFESAVDIWNAEACLELCILSPEPGDPAPNRALHLDGRTDLGPEVVSQVEFFSNLCTGEISQSVISVVPGRADELTEQEMVRDVGRALGFVAVSGATSAVSQVDPTGFLTDEDLDALCTFYGAGSPCE
ncbi:MAG: hypothetical protein AAGF12_35000 [Myxococcota bacterium]